LLLHEISTPEKNQLTNLNMTKTILIMLALFPVFLFAQKTIKVNDKENSELYFVLKSDKVTRQGEYKRIGYRNSVLIKGYYKNGVRDSIWEYYDYDGKVIQRYDFTKNELTYYSLTDEEKSKKYRLINGAGNQEISLTRPPLYLGGTDNLNFALAKEINYPRMATENGKMGTVNVVFTIDKNGRTSNYHVDTPLGYGLDEESIRVVKLLADNWLPGLLNGEAVDIEYTQPVKYTLVDN